MTYRQNHISQKEANRILNMDKQELLSYITVEDGKSKSSRINGIEIEIGWDNPKIAIISHFWLDPKMRNAGLGTSIFLDLINQLKNINRIKTVFTSIQSSDGATKYILEKCGFKNIKSYDKRQYSSSIIEGEITFD
jgi:RimJ/RimL family protein N-acetyltransferase